MFLGSLLHHEGRFLRKGALQATEQFPACRPPSSIRCVAEVKRRVARSLLSSVERERLRHLRGNGVFFCTFCWLQRAKYDKLGTFFGTSIETTS